MHFQDILAAPTTVLVVVHSIHSYTMAFIEIKEFLFQSFIS
jgi:hypothetical protein